MLAGGLGTASDPDYSVVRTLVADVDEKGRVLSAYLVEFVSEDAQESQFKEYVEQWLTGDFGNKSMLVAEYTIGYASTSAMFYAPGKDPRPITMRLVEKSGPGKTEATWYCWESGRWEIEICEPYTGDTPPDDHECISDEYVEITCVWRDDGYGDPPGGGGCPGCVDPGDSGGGDDDDDDDSQCTDDQKAIAKEYGDETNWPCEKFVDAVINGGDHSHVTGYLSGAYMSGRIGVRSYMTSMYGISALINSDWCCPEGNTLAGGVPRSQHRKGTAGDFDADGFNQVIWLKFEVAAIAAGSGWYSPYGTGSGQYTGHIHIDWR